MPVYWINANHARLGIMARPRGHDWLLDDLRALKQSGVDVVVSALTAREADDLGLSAEADSCVEKRIALPSVPYRG